MLRVGLISDTHGLLRPEALAELAGSDLLLHAGDVGGPEIIARLEEIAPLHVVRGNVDREPYAREWPKYVLLPVAGLDVLLFHGHLAPPEERLAEAKVVVQGHTHRPYVEWRSGRLHINPGSAGPRRFRLPVTVARLVIDAGTPSSEIVILR
jgi:putative phosphoesterase